MTEGDEWPRILADARECALKELDAIEARPLEVGQYIAWTELAPRGAITDGLSAVHRVAQVGQKPQTYCGEQIPGAIRLFTLTPRLIASMHPCRWCAQAIALSTKGAA
jgi:hypothetical protein